MNANHGSSNGSRFLLTTASFVVVVAGMRAAGSILVPFLLAIFIAIICSPALYWMRLKRIPSGLAIVLILVGVVAIITFFGTIMGTSLGGFTQALPQYQQKLTEQTHQAADWLAQHGIEIADEQISEYFNPGRAMRMVANLLAGLSGALTNTFMILLTVVFILLEASGFPVKLKAAFGDQESSTDQLGAITESINRYLGIKTAFSAMTGIVIWVWLRILGVDYPLLWASIAFLLNYVPNIGSIIAAVPAVLLAVVQLGPGSALLTAAGYLAVNTVFGSILEPRFMGKGLGLSTLVVFLSLVFWGWVLGPVGMLLSVPLTMILKIALEANEDTRWIAILMGGEPAPEPGSALRE